MNRRLSFNLDDEEAVPNSNGPEPQQGPPAHSTTGPPPPPNYTSYHPGGILEFVKDIEAYQAACLIHKVVDNPIDELGPSPAYALDDFENVITADTGGYKEVFRARFQERLMKLDDYLRKRPQGTVKRFLSDKVKLLISFIVLIVAAGGAVAVAVTLWQRAFTFVFITVWAVAFLYFLRTGWQYYHKRRLLKAIKTALEKVDKFESLDGKTIQVIKHGAENGVPKSYWVDSGTRLRVIASRAEAVHRPTQ
ncbi:hypothetical protein ABW20_dc0104645 [Dactylellina cionopaga]|nr:hypothetical protein ABW20_dc0104645 [Dactylellina cionopaga]